MKIHTLIMIGCFALASITQLQAQTKERLIADFTRAKAYTLEYLEIMPGDKYNFKPTPEIRSFAQQMLHIADVNYSITAAALGIASPMAQGANENMENPTKIKVIANITNSYDFIINAIQGATDEQLGEETMLFGKFKLTSAVALSKVFEHQTHHRGQTTIYLRLSGITPPSEKLF